MSRLNELIAKLCPDGVEYRNLGTICEVTKGLQVNKTDMNKVGSFPVINGGIEPSGYIERYNQIANTITISQGGASAGYVNWIPTKFWAGAHCYVLKPSDCVLNRYLYHFVKANEHTLQECQYGAGIPALAKSTIVNLLLPIPPLEVQREIVRILDNFTELIEKLTVELDNREKQFQYYCDQLICCPGKALSEGWIKTTLDRVGTLTRGKRFVKADSAGLLDGVPCIHYGELYTYYGVSTDKTISFINDDLAKKMRFAKKDDVIIVGAGENNIDIGVGVAWLGNQKVAVHDACYIYEHSENPEFISYYLRTNFYHDQLKQHVSEGKICAVSAKDIGRSIIFLPPIEIQNSIVEKLNTFYKLYNDSIPKEIEMRKKQYEFYRDKMLKGVL